MKTYYYSTSDSVYDSWSDSDLKKWLVDHNVIKSDAQVTREKMLKMIQSVIPKCLHDAFTDFILGVTTFLRTTPSGVLGPTIKFAVGLLNMVTCAPMLKSSATSLSNWLTRSMYAFSNLGLR